MAREKILVVDDESDIRDIIVRYLTKEFYTVMVADNGQLALELIETKNPDLVILDIVLPDTDGFSICPQIRGLTSCPILFLSCKDDEVDKILGLSLGGDDYITKPFSPRELVARIKSHLRRNQIISSNSSYSNLIEFDNLVIDLDGYQVKIDEQSIPLPAKEFKILSILAQSPNRIFSSDQLYDLVWNENSIGDTRTVLVHISNLRKKIERDPSNPKYIVTVRGVGYKFSY